MKFGSSLLFLLILFCLNHQLGLADDCNWVSDHCPVWNGWSTPKCRIDDQVCQGTYCYRYVCTYCNAKMFGCNVDISGGVQGHIISANPQGPYNCYGMEIRGQSQFYVHCGCGGTCSFHGNWKVIYQKWRKEENMLSIDQTQS